MAIDPTRTGRDALNAGFDPTRATPPPLLGIINSTYGFIEVYCAGDGTVTLQAPDTEWSAEFPPAARDELRELLDRAAMPGQPLPQAAPTREEIDRCGYSEDPFHRCRVCYDYAAGRERDHPLTAALPGQEGRRADGEPPAGEARDA